MYVCPSLKVFIICIYNLNKNVFRDCKIKNKNAQKNTIFSDIFLLI